MTSALTGTAVGGRAATPSRGAGDGEVGAHATAGSAARGSACGEVDRRRKAGRNFTDVGRTRAHQLARGEPLSDAEVKKVKAYFARHEVDKKASGFKRGSAGFPSPGRVAWDAWGGDAGERWVRGLEV